MLPMDLVEKHTPGNYEKARLRFAHAETVIPFTCLLGLFLERSGEDLAITSLNSRVIFGRIKLFKTSFFSMNF